MTRANIVAVAYLVSVALFIVGLKRLQGVRTARSGNALAALGMLVAVLATLVEQGRIDVRWIVSGVLLGGAIGVATVLRAKATQMPEIVARFNGFGGAASALVALALFWRAVVEPPEVTIAANALGSAGAATLVLSVLIGAATLSGSVMAELKLRGIMRGLFTLPGQQVVMAGLVATAIGVGSLATFTSTAEGSAQLMVLTVVAASLAVGVLLVLPIGGADMPVVISLLNSLSGLAAAATGFALGHNLLIIAGTIVGASGLILTQVMCVAMNRSLAAVLVGGVGGEDTTEGASDYENVVSCGAEEAALVLENAQSVVIVPGYGLAAARAQHSAYDLVKTLEARGCEVRFAIHPVAGRMPGHMNVVLAEAEVPYELLLELDEINHEFKTTDVAIVVGANDVVNPAARTSPGSPIYGMPILDVEEAKQVFVIKRSLSPGYAGIKNELFERPNTVMIYGDAKDVLHELSSTLSATKVGAR